MTAFPRVETLGAMPDGRPVHRARIASPDGAMRATVLDYGARLASLVVPDASGRPTEVTLGRDGLAAWLDDDVCMGAIMGRNTSRVSGARCVIDGEEYRLADNDNGNNAHSGPHGFERALWRIDGVAPAGDAVTLRLVSPHLSQGFPGTMDVAVTYTLGGGALTIAIAATADRATVCNPTSHIYWNLDGGICDAPDALGHMLRIPADRYFPTDGGFLPLGAAPVDGTPFDLREPRRLREAMAAFPDDPQLAIGRGYNHAYDFAAEYAGPDGEHPLVPMATLVGERSGIAMDLSCDAPALVVYSSGWFDGLAGRDGRVYGPGAGLALEPGFVPNAINDDHGGTTPRPLLEAGRTFRMTIRYAFRA